MGVGGSRLVMPRHPVNVGRSGTPGDGCAAFRGAFPAGAFPAGALRLGALVLPSAGSPLLSGDGSWALLAWADRRSAKEHVASQLFCLVTFRCATGPHVIDAGVAGLWHGRAAVDLQIRIVAGIAERERHDHLGQTIGTCSRVAIVADPVGGLCTHEWLKLQPGEHWESLALHLVRALGAVGVGGSRI